MILSAPDIKKISPEELDTVDHFVNGYMSGNLTHGQILDMLHKIKLLPADVSSALWQKFRDNLSMEEYDRLHRFYVEWTLGQRWGK